MAGLLGVNEELKVFKCPNYGNYISSKNDVCPKCLFPLPSDLKQSAIETQDEEVKQANRKFYKNFIYVGIGLFALGGLLLLQTAVTFLYVGSGRFFIWSPFLTLLGLGQIIYGLNGLRKER